MDMDIAENIDIENTENAEIAAVKPARNLRKERTGIVVSNKMSKTIVVKIEERVTHAKYGKIMRRSIKFKAHDEKNECDIGDKVLIMETRPLSKDKHFRLVRILEKVK
jgi:small subunit ribosomal protein S17